MSRVDRSSPRRAQHVVAADPVQGDACAERFAGAHPIQAEINGIREEVHRVHGFAPPRAWRHRVSATQAACIRLVEDALAFCKEWNATFNLPAQHDGMPLLPHELSECAAAYGFRASALLQRFDALAEVPDEFEPALRKAVDFCSEVRKTAAEIGRRDTAFTLARFHPLLT